MIDDTERIEALHLRTRIVNALRARDIYTIGDLVKRSEADLTDPWMRNFGPKSLDEVKRALAVHGLSLAVRDYRPELEPKPLYTVEDGLRDIAEALQNIARAVAKQTGYEPWEPLRHPLDN
jgi:hypothetical protein